MNILVLNGPGINKLGTREPAIYGERTYDDLLILIENYCTLKGIEVSTAQSNHEGELLDCIWDSEGCFDGIVINPAAFTHTSIALRDAIKGCGVPTVEVHLSDIQQREDFRKISYVKDVCIATFCGFGFDGYLMAIDSLINYLEKNNA